MPAAPCRMSSRRWRKYCRPRSVRSRRSSAGPRCRPSSTCSAACSQRSTRSSSAAAWPIPFWPRADIPWENRCASRISGRTRARSQLRRRAKAKGRELILRVDAVVAKTFAANAPSRVVAVDGVGGDEMILDIGPRSIEHVCSVLARVKTLVWNGPFGAFELEPFDIGTVEVAEAAAELTAARKIITVAGGGDTVAALNAAGATGQFTYVSTAGGAFLECLEGKPLPGVEVLRVG